MNAMMLYDACLSMSSLSCTALTSAGSSTSTGLATTVVNIMENTIASTHMYTYKLILTTLAD
jgi:hypothetical protein